MSAGYAYTPQLWPPLAGAIFLAAIGLYSWRRRDVPGALPLTAGTLFGALWLLGMACEAAAVSPATALVWRRFQAIMQLPAATATVCFALEYVAPGRWLSRRTVFLLFGLVAMYGQLHTQLGLLAQKRLQRILDHVPAVRAGLRIDQKPFIQHRIHSPDQRASFHAKPADMYQRE